MALLILFDIDGTLIDTGGAALRALGKAVADRLGSNAPLPELAVAGKTDPQIVRELLLGLGVDPGDNIAAAILEKYLVHLRQELANGTGRLHPGVAELLENLAKNPEFHLGLLTGNLEQGAFIKLEAFGLRQYFRLGAYGSDSADRDQLLPIALSRLWQQEGVALEPRQCVLLGDTPRDVACARTHGAWAVAVATGPYCKCTLQEADAHLVLEDFRQQRPLMDFIARVASGGPR